MYYGLIYSELKNARNTSLIKNEYQHPHIKLVISSGLTLVTLPKTVISRSLIDDSTANTLSPVPSLTS